MMRNPAPMATMPAHSNPDGVAPCHAHSRRMLSGVDKSVPTDMKIGFVTAKPIAMRKLNKTSRAPRPISIPHTVPESVGIWLNDCGVMAPTAAVPALSDQQPRIASTSKTSRMEASPNTRLKSTLYIAAQNAAPSTSTQPITSDPPLLPSSRAHGCAMTATPTPDSVTASKEAAVSGRLSSGTARMATNAGVTLKIPRTREELIVASACTYSEFAPAQSR
mmetsp:Transcript_10888/g.23752  ORF Transcript_10888/g.23752 Transcript_10888/m.23752 type:complete len:220 (+) Transcript_10888:256-915(+)